MKRNPFAVLICFFGVISMLLCSAVEAQDYYLPAGGSPCFFKGAKTISLQNETIHITVGDKKVKADCTYTFKNSGPASTIKMGSPDVGGEGPGGVSSVFKPFKSYVDGRQLKAKFVRVGKGYWQITTVPFPKNGKRVIRNVFTLDKGGFITSDGYISEVSHILNTGASWKGNIGRSNIVITFNRSMGAKQLIPVLLPSVAKDVTELYKLDWSAYSKGYVIYKGLSKPTVKGKTLRFTRSNWSPTQKDDITVWFGYRSTEQMRNS